ncbi:MAG: hypothetical protein U0Y68_23575 [Blastocatellia bacterium]
MNEMTWKQYLLGALPAPEQAQLELQLLSDDEAYQQLLWAEDDLIEAYLQEELSHRERENFERIFLAHPARQEKLRLTRALIAHANPVPLPQMDTRPISEAAGRWWRFWPLDWKFAATTALALVALGIIVYLAQTNSSVPEALHNATLPVARAPVSPAMPPPTGNQTKTVELSSGQAMDIGSTLPEIVLTPDIGQVQLRLWLRRDHWETYQVTLQPADLPARVLPDTFPRQTANGLSFIEVTLPVMELQANEVTLKLAGITLQKDLAPADHYSFKVKHQ